MRRLVFILASVSVFAVLNYGIYEKESLKASGETVLLELAPVDPRSLLQGDYMRLRYSLERNTPPAGDNRGFMVISTDNNKVARFVRFHAGEDLLPAERLLRFQKLYGTIQIIPDSYMFQEGHAQRYQRARYGIFKFGSAGKHMLVGLADDEFRAIDDGQ